MQYIWLPDSIEEVRCLCVLWRLCSEHQSKHIRHLCGTTHTSTHTHTYGHTQKLEKRTSLSRTKTCGRAGNLILSDLFDFKLVISGRRKSCIVRSSFEPLSSGTINAGVNWASTYSIALRCMQHLARQWFSAVVHWPSVNIFSRLFVVLC